MDQPPGWQLYKAFVLAAAWIIPFLLIVGGLQISVTEMILFSTSFFGKVVPLFFCIIVVFITGLYADSMINQKFRDAITSLDSTIQFTVDTINNPQLDPALARSMHSGALASVKEYLDGSRRLVVFQFDKVFSNIHVLVISQNKWIDCIVVNAQASYCKLIEK
jgi:hypothetical protein